MIWFNGVLLVVDGLSTDLDGLSGRYARKFLELLMIAGLSAQTFISYVWMRYVFEVTGTKRCSTRSANFLFFHLSWWYL